MTGTLTIAADLLREAASRRWFLGLGLALTAMLAALGLSVRLEVVDGALAASRLFGAAMSNEIVPVDVALRPIFQFVAHAVFWGGLVFGIVSCADFGPSLLAAGRIEFLLALPVRRRQLLLGTFLGVFTLALAGAVYGSGGVALILGVKTGVFTIRPVIAGVLAATAFASIYAAMLTTALFVRSAALSAGVGGALLIAGAIASYREQVMDLLQPGVTRAVFGGVSLVLPRTAALADAGAAIAGSQPVEAWPLAGLVAGVLAFGAAALAIGAFRFEGRDF